MAERASQPAFTIEELARGTRGAAAEEWLGVRNAIDLWSMSPEGLALREESEVVGLRLGARVDGSLVGVGQAVADTFQAGQHEAAVRIYVLPEARGMGIGRAFFERFVAFARELDLTQFVTRVDAGDEASLAFAQRRGFRLLSTQQLGLFDLGSMALDQPPELPDGIAVVSIAERPDLLTATFEVYAAAIPEVPSLADLEPLTIDVWRASQEEAQYRKDLSLIAYDAEGVVGHIEVTDDGDRRAFISMLAVAPRARRRGVARGLKQALAHRAASAGWRELVTLNDGTNDAIRRLNESLGYRYMPESLFLIGPVGGG